MREWQDVARLVGVVCAVPIATSACSMAMTVTYSPIAAVETLAAPGAEPRAYVARFSDERPDKDRDQIGVMKSAVGLKVKKLVTTDDFGTVLAEATTDALRKAGIEAELHLDRTATEEIPAEELKGYAMVFGGRMTNVEIVSQPGWDTLKINARVVIDLYVKGMNSEAEWLGPIEGTAERREINVLTSQSLTLALDSAIQDCVRNMIRHVRASGSVVP